MKNCFTICIDMDDTIEELLPAWLDWLNKKYDLEVKYSDAVCWGMEVLYPELTSEQIYSPLSDREFWKTVMPVYEAPRYLQRLVDQGQIIYIVTASRYDTIQVKLEEVLFKYFPMIDENNVIITDNKQMINCDIMIDDCPTNLYGGNYYKLLVDAPYNRNIKENDFRRVYSWQEIYNVIQDLDWFYTCEKKNTKQ